jgi:glycosyltransferase involved in cell wall biosynthesis
MPQAGHRGGGWVLPAPGDPQALADAIRELCDDPDRCRRFGENGRHYAEAHLSKEAVAARYEALFAVVAGQA